MKTKKEFLSDFKKMISGELPSKKMTAKWGDVVCFEDDFAIEAERAKTDAFEQANKSLIK